MSNVDDIAACHATKCSRFAATTLAFALSLPIMLILVHAIQPDILTAATMIPPWLWLLPAIVLLGFGFRAARNWSWRLAAALWLVFAICYIEQTWSIPRWIFKSPAVAAQSSATFDGIRVATLNCNGGKLAGGRETGKFRPDIVLLQESPDKESLKLLAFELFGDEGSVVSSGDTSVIARGQLTKVEEASTDFMTTALLSVDDRRLLVCSVRLRPPSFQIDFWTRDFWLAHATTRRRQREQVEAIAKAMATHASSNVAVIVGGDFNCVAGDASTWELNRHVRDSFRNSGVGWGATGTNQYPLFRVDQIWNNDKLSPKVVTARKTNHSDHKMVVADFNWSDQP